MKPEIKQKWLNALRGGEYSQGRYQLHDEDDRFCCLGVLCDLYLKEHNKEWIKGEEQFAYLIPSGDNAFGEVLTQEVVEWSGLELHNPELIVNNKGVVISDLNDTENYSFDQIADLIEAQL